jgi:hypothetical protein
MNLEQWQVALLAYCVVCWLVEAKKYWDFIPTIKHDKRMDGSDLPDPIKAAVIAVFGLFVIFFAPLTMPCKVVFSAAKKISQYRLRKSFIELGFSSEDADTLLEQLDSMTSAEVEDFHNRLSEALDEALEAAECPNQGSKTFSVKYRVPPEQSPKTS